MSIHDVNLFTGGNLVIGRAGRATVTKTIDPEGDIDVLHADAFSDLRVIPGRAGASDITVRGLEEQAQRRGLAARLEHHARFGGTIEIQGREHTLLEVNGDKLTVMDRDGTIRRFDLEHIALRFGAVEPPYVPNPAPSIRVFLAGTAGADRLHLRAELDAASGEVLHQILLTNAADQKNIQAELASFVGVTNNTGVPLTDMSLALRLNEPARPRRMAKVMAMRAPAGGMLEMEGLDEDADIDPVREAAASGVITMPVAAGVTLRPGETRTLNIAAAVAGKPNEPIGFVPVTLRQDLTLGLWITPGAPGDKVSSKGSPRASYTMSGTPAQQPAGTYEIYEGDDLAGLLTTSEYTEKETKITIPGATMRSIEASWTVTTAAVKEGRWARAVDVTASQGRRGAQRQERINTFSMAATIELSSKSELDREVDLRIAVGSFDRGVTNIRARVDGAPLEAASSEAEETLTLPGVRLRAGAATTVTLSFDGLKTERRDVSTTARRRLPG